MTDKINITQLLNSSTIFKNVPKSELDIINNLFQVKHYKKSDILFHNGEESNAAYMLITGKIGFYQQNQSGKEVFLSYILPHLWLGYQESIDGRRRDSTARIEEDSTILHISGNQLANLIDNNHQIAINLVSDLCKSHGYWSRAITESVLNSLAYRLAKQLSRIGRMNTGDIDPEHNVSIKLTQEELANMMGASRQSISKILKHWEKNRLLIITPGQLTIPIMGNLIQYAKNNQP